MVDSGYSFTHIAPFYKDKAILEAAVKHLKEIISYRQLHVLDETYVINQVKEDVCYVTLDLRIKDMDIAKWRGSSQ